MLEVDAQKLILERNQKGGAYHKITFPDGIILNGIYDMKNYLDFYKIPHDLHGKTVLEVGTSNGFFAQEIYKRGADRVVAIDFHISPLHEALNLLMGTKVEFVAKDLFDLDENFGKFDLVFCSHVLQHVSDPFGALRKLRSVTKEMVIITTTYLDNFPQFEDYPILYFIGEEKEAKIQQGTYWTFHRSNRKCLRKMLEAAKFKEVKEISTHYVVSEDKRWKIPSVVFHAIV